MSVRNPHTNAVNDNIDSSLSSISFLSLMTVLGVATFLLIEIAFQMTGAMNGFMGFDPSMVSPTFLKGEKQ